MSKYLPTGPRLVQETAVVMFSVLAAAWIISRFPKVKAFVKANSVTVNDQTGNPLF